MASRMAFRAAVASRTAVAPKLSARTQVRRFASEPPAKVVTPSFKNDKNEGWETLYNVGFYGTMVLTGVLLYFKPETDIGVWARDEALVREALEQEGEEIELGRVYSQEKHGDIFVKGAVGERPTRSN
mmetsp:Transcript_4032/g.7075  ORF Transcript_4032/g.7075 Transcript_4032/m.7075 type:complete len:128 (-) Transcript_4032:27-410(-)|eukprot:CAMPEP_0184523334 /NCGR_PEP_ID=MMETSP0198_2-20121128/8820_1 /TAXON_ID=1112570 /ORGANISM="Thraustochytrium sp., Strain LLF1b" /LENGTH=127 /DNA_ID=CAMNT_0026914341 /DNA_START=261 /DNA_END=644 /DNA_ORIENTATION=-